MRPSTSRANHGALLEREQELAVIEGLMQRAQANDSAVALVEGPAGIGKSRLLRELRERALDAGLRTLAARGSDLERGLPFGVVRQLFEPALADPDHKRRWLSGSAVAAARVFDPAAVGNPFDDAGFSVLYGLSWLTTNIAADGPLLIAIDDLQWADRASLRFLAYLIRRLEGVGVLVAATVRLGEPQLDSRLLREILQDPTAVPIRPQALSEAAVLELVGERLGAGAEPSFVAACRRGTGGNPLLLDEVLKSLQAEGVRPDALHADVVRDVGPRAVSRWVLLRLARLSADAVAVAGAVAVLGDGAALPETAAVAGIDEQRTARATGALIAAEILQSDSPNGFVHPLVRDAVYLDLASVERELAHERAAITLIERGAETELVAAHLLVAPNRSDGRVAALLHEAGQAAVRRGDADSAVPYLRRSLAESPQSDKRSSLLIDLGMAEALADDKAASAMHLGAGYEAIEDPRERAMAAETLARVLLFTAPASEAAAVARRAADELPSELADLRWRLEALELFTTTFGASVPDAAARLRQARNGLRGEGPGARMLAAVAAATWALTGGSAAECCELALAALADGVLIAAEPALMPGVAGTVLEFADRDEVLAIWEARTAEAHRSGSAMALGGIYVAQGGTWLARGELSEAEAALQRANAEIDPWSSAPAEVVFGSAYLAEVLIERGDIAGARELLDAQPVSPPGSDADSLLRRAEVRLLLAERRWGEALQAAQEYAGTLRDGIVNPAWAPWRSLQALALAGVGRSDEAIALLEDELIWARRWEAPRTLGRTLRLLGTIGGLTNVELLDEAVNVTANTPAQLEHAKSLVALGSALRLARKPSAARAPLRRGLELAARCGAQPLVEHARTELYTAGGRPRRQTLTGLESLTPSERRVAQLAAEGQGNREIAQTLYVTPKTIEVHLTSVYRKLGISARTGLAELLSSSTAG